MLLDLPWVIIFVLPIDIVVGLSYIRDDFEGKCQCFLSLIYVAIHAIDAYI